LLVGATTCLKWRVIAINCYGKYLKASPDVVIDMLYAQPEGWRREALNGFLESPPGREVLLIESIHQIEALAMPLLALEDIDSALFAIIKRDGYYQVVYVIEAPGMGEGSADCDEHSKIVVLFEYLELIADQENAYVAGRDRECEVRKTNARFVPKMVSGILSSSVLRVAKPGN